MFALLGIMKEFLSVQISSFNDEITAFMCSTCLWSDTILITAIFHATI